MVLPFQRICSTSGLNRLPLQLGQTWLIAPIIPSERVMTPAPSQVAQRPRLLLNENALFESPSVLACGDFANRFLIFTAKPVYVAGLLRGVFPMGRSETRSNLIP